MMRAILLYFASVRNSYRVHSPSAFSTWFCDIFESVIVKPQACSSYRSVTSSLKAVAVSPITLLLEPLILHS